MRRSGAEGVVYFVCQRHKRQFLSDAKYLAHKGFMVADTSSCGIMLMYLPFGSDTEPPQFKECAKYPTADGDGFVLYYTDQCPFSPLLGATRGSGSRRAQHCI